MQLGGCKVILVYTYSMQENNKVGDAILVDLTIVFSSLDKECGTNLGMIDYLLPDF